MSFVGRVLRGFGGALLRDSDTRPFDPLRHAMLGFAGPRTPGDPWQVVRRGVTIDVALVARGDGRRGTHVQLRAALARPALRGVVERGWTPRVVPPPEPGAALPDPLAAGWARALAPVAHAVIVATRDAVTARVDEPVGCDGLAIVADVVAAIARWDEARAADLLALAGARPLAAIELAPAVTLAPDGLRLGVAAGATVAELAGVSGAAPAPEHAAALAASGAASLDVTAGVATLRWPAVERDRRRLAAGVAALRALRPAGGPYR